MDQQDFIGRLRSLSKIRDEVGGEHVCQAGSVVIVHAPEAAGLQHLDLFDRNWCGYTIFHQCAFPVRAPTEPCHRTMSAATV
jgi:hypothetical protein